MKEDVQIPTAVPRKRRELERVLDVWIATWLAGDITPSERRRLAEEKERRKRVRAAGVRRVGLLIGEEGCTPEQHEALIVALRGLDPTEIHHPGVASRLHQACRASGVPVIVHDSMGMREVVRVTDIVIAAPKELQPAKSPVWEMIRYAKHRGIAALIVTSAGTTQE